MELLINIDVPDIAGATRFYCEAFGFVIGRHLGDDFVELLGATAPIYLLLKPAGSAPFAGASVPRTYDPHWTPVHFDLAVSDLSAALARAQAAGARMESEIVEEPYGKLVLLRDPFGHGICLLQFNERGYDALVTS